MIGQSKNNYKEQLEKLAKDHSIFHDKILKEVDRNPKLESLADRIVLARKLEIKRLRLEMTRDDS